MPNRPVVWLAQGDVTINGYIDLSGSNGNTTSSGRSVAQTTNELGLASPLTIESCTATAADKQLARTSPAADVEHIEVGGNLNPLADGVLYTCLVRIAADTAGGTYAVSNSAAASDVGGAPIANVQGAAGQVAVTTCAADCNGNGAVTIGELIRCVNRFLGAPACDVADASMSCSVADSDGDGSVTLGETSRCVSAFLSECTEPAVGNSQSPMERLRRPRDRRSGVATQSRRSH